MKETRLFGCGQWLTALCLAAVLDVSLSTVLAQGTAFTYQGRLAANGNAAHGSYDLRFRLATDALGNSYAGGPYLTNAVAVSEGLFTVTLDFGGAVFNGSNYWLQVEVKTNGAGGYTTLNPLQQLTPTPYAIFAAGVPATGINGNISPASIGAGTITSGMIATGAVTAAQLAAGSVTTSSLANDAVTLDKLNTVSLPLGTVTLTNPTPASTEYFGISMAAVGSEHVLIGAHLAFSSVPSSGEAYLFDAVGRLVTTFTNPTPAINDQFGYAIAALGNDKVIIGANYDDIGAQGAGTVYLFSTNGTLITTFTNPAPGLDDQFGAAVAAVGTDKMLVGVPSDDTGAGNSGVAYLFSTNGTLLVTFTNPTPSASDFYGTSVAGVGADAVLIGTLLGDEGGLNAGGAYLYNTSGALITRFVNPTPSAADSFGTTLAAFGNDRVLLGAYDDSVGASQAGVVHLFSTNGTLLVTITNPAPNSADRFGSGIAAAGTDRIIIGALWDDTSANDSGSAYLFDTNGTLLATFANPTPAASDLFGYAVAALGGNRFAAGASQDNTGASRAGTAYIFSLGELMPGLIAAGVADGGVTTASLAAGAVTSVHIADGAITVTDLATNIGVWARAGANIFYTNGNVGIGTGTPTTALHVNGVVTATQFSGSGAGLTSVWRLQGNAGTTPGTDFLGTTDNQAVELKVNGQRALRLEPHPSSPRLIGGFNGNSAVAGAHGVVIGGGGFAGNVNRADALLTVIVGGSANTNAADGAFIGGGFQNTIQTQAYNATIVGGVYHNVNSNSAYSAIGGGWDNNVNNNSPYSVIAGGIFNDIGTNSGSSTISGGNNNNISTESAHATISGGLVNNVGTNSPGGTIGGGRNHSIAGDSPYATIAGGSFGRIGNEAPFSFIGGGEDHTIAGFCAYSVIAGGNFNSIGTNSGYSFIGGGEANRITVNAYSSVIGGGLQNDVGTNSNFSVIAGGEDNDIGNDGTYNTIGGGYNNNIVYGPVASTIAGGYNNNIGTNADYGTIGGGLANIIALNSSYATIPGGIGNFATNRAFAAGNRAKANHSGAFVWADNSIALDVPSTNNNSVTMRAAGGYRLFSGTGAQGVYLAPNGGSWTSLSDRNAKENFEPVNARTVLDKVAALPLSTWNYKAQTNGVRHIGPMAQDFKAAFGVGETDTGITTVDADGVALAAIQGMNVKLNETSAAHAREMNEKDARIQALEQKLSRLESWIEQLSATKSQP